MADAVTNKGTMERLVGSISENNIAGFTNADTVSIVKEEVHPLHNLYHVVSRQAADRPVLATFIASKESEPAGVSAVDRDYQTRQELLILVPGSCAKVLAYNPNKHILLLEDTSNLEDLQRRIFTDCKVDHGITCNLARLLANIHKSTHRNRMTDNEFKLLSQRFGGSAATEFYIHKIFVKPFDAGSVVADLDPRLSQAIKSLLGNQQLLTTVSNLKQMFDTNKECLVLTNVNLSSVLVQPKDGKVMVKNLTSAMVGPSAFDVGTLLAHYIIAYYTHMLTEENNDFHRRIMYAVQEAMQKTAEVYLDELTALNPDRVQFQTDLLTNAIGFAGVELFRWCSEKSGQPDIPISTKLDILQAAQRLLGVRRPIDTAGRLLMIALQLC